MKGWSSGSRRWFDRQILTNSASPEKSVPQGLKAPFLAGVLLPGLKPRPTAREAPGYRLFVGFDAPTVQVLERAGVHFEQISRGVEVATLGGDEGLELRFTPLVR
jgi:hypothetical protein